MSDIAIRVDNLGKHYHVDKRERYKTLRDTCTDTLTAPIHWLRGRDARNGTGHQEYPRMNLRHWDVQYAMPLLSS